jgi:uncharacterized protein with von Willebrand factor type A (vWA) domain
LELTPKALRRLGDTALRRIFDQLEAMGSGDHDDRRSGAADERTGAVLPWEFGDERPIDAVRTVHNAVLRRAESGDSVVRLAVEDFAVAETERRTTAAVALLVDLSFSMVQEERWGPMKQTAIALSHLVATRFRQDALQIIGFDRLARRMTPLQLAQVEPEFVQGTNLHHALLLAGRHLGRHPEAEPVVLIVTDGEPTAHLERGRSYFAYPPSPITIRETLKEVKRCTQKDIVINTFMLDRNYYLKEFVNQVAKINKGRVFYTTPDKLGSISSTISNLAARRRVHLRSGADRRSRRSGPALHRCRAPACRCPAGR